MNPLQTEPLARDRVASAYRDAARAPLWTDRTPRPPTRGPLLSSSTLADHLTGLVRAAAARLPAARPTS